MDPLFDLSSSRAVVTGGGRGIGLAVATEFASRGMRVVVWDRDQEALAEARSELESYGDQIAFQSVDVSDPDAVRAAAAETEAGGAIDVLVNNAGITSKRRPAVEIPFEDWQRMLAVNLTGPWNTCQAFGPRMLQRRKGSVINLASTNAVDPSPGIAHYTVTKAGVAMLTKNLALEWAADGVRVNAIGPGPIQTPATLPLLEDPALRARWEAGVPMGRLGTPRDLIGMFVYLASPASSWVTGRTFYVDGGWLL